MPSRALLALLASAALPAIAQGFPSRPVQVVSASNTGSTGDVAIRLVAVKMSDSLGQRLLVENRVGAAGAIAVAAVKKSPPDGHTLLFSGGADMTSARFLSKNLSFDSQKDLAPVSLVVDVWPFLVVSAHVPVASVAELVAFAKQHPNKLTYASLGIGSSFHLLGESLKRFTGTELRHVPYSQGGTVMVATDVVAGRVDTTFISYTNLQPHLAGGKLRVLAYTGEKRFRQLPDVPALTEALPGLAVAPQFFALLGPAALPPALASRLAGETRKALQDADIAAKLEGLGMVPVGSTPEALAAVIQRGIDISGDLVRSLGIPPR